MNGSDGGAAVAGGQRAASTHPNPLIHIPAGKKCKKCTARKIIKKSNKSNWLGSLEGRQWLLVAARKAQHEKSQKQEMQEMLCKIQKILEITKLTKSNSLVVLMSEKKVRT